MKQEPYKYNILLEEIREKCGFTRSEMGRACGTSLTNIINHATMSFVLRKKIFLKYLVSLNNYLNNKIDQNNNSIETYIGIKNNIERLVILD